MTRTELLEKYLEAAERLRFDAEREEKTLLALSLLRLFCFFGGLIVSLYFFLNHPAIYGITAALLTIIIFLYLLKRYSRHTSGKKLSEALGRINSDEAKALNGDNSPFNPGNGYINNSHDFSYDVDLFGVNSLFQYLNRTVTGYGREILATWLSDPYYLAGEMAGRQQIIKELAVKVNWRHRFMAAGKEVPLEKDRIESLMKWLAEPPFIESSPFRKTLIFLLPAIALISLMLLVSGIIHYSVFVIVVLINLGHVAAGLKTTNYIHNAVSGRYDYLSAMKSLLEAFENDSFESEQLRSMKEQISGNRVSASVAVKKIGKLIRSFDSRLNILAGFALNAILLWDFHCIRNLEKWKLEFRDHFPLWLEILGKVDAFSSLANYAYNNQDHVYAVITDDTILKAEGLGHPLISEEKRVSNDFSIDKQGSVCIVTGANMAGKSTFLRTVAVNFILAMSGGPVCARQFKFMPVKLFTSMRTTDSLAGNESYFYAELKRLRTLKLLILDNEPVFFILDEILKGTNSADKSLGSLMFIRKLIPGTGTGLVATHDTSLGELENEFPGTVFNMCFEIEIDGERIGFDYKLRRGITKKMNAALLMRQMGILD